MPRVLNLRTHPIPPDAVRIDRTTKWGNPFVVGVDGGRDECCDKYAEWFPKQKHLVAALHELRGKDVACWCEPLRCHGHYLVRRANEDA